MAIQIITPPDYNVLARSLLPYAKMQGNVTFCDDDLKLVEFTRRAIALFERFSVITLNPATYRWIIGAGDFSGTLLDCPITPVVNWNARSGAEDVSLNYGMLLKGHVGIELYCLSGQAAALNVDIQTGYADADLMPPGIRDIVMRLAAQLYEYREVYIVSDAEPQGDWVEQTMAGYWKPRC